MTNEPSPRPWRVNSVTGGHISDANGDPVCFCVGSNCGERAALIVDAVNWYCDWGALSAELERLRSERDRLRAELADKTRNYEDVIAFHTRTEESLRDIVRNAIETLNQVYKHADMTDALREVVAETQREARAAIVEDAR